MKRLFLFVALFCATLSVSAQSAKEEIRQNPALAAGKYYAYQAPDVELVPAPEGYEPFYISMFARHGSRYRLWLSCVMPRSRVFLPPTGNGHSK